MPYIRKEEREQFKAMFNACKGITTKGQLEFCVYVLMKIFMEDKEKRYSTYHDCVYAVVHAAHEYERTHLDKREDQAIIENGDI